MLRLEATLGLAIPADREADMLRNLQALLDNPDGLLMNLPDEALMGDRPRFINPHNFREGLLALGTMARVRGSQWAVAAGLRLLRTLDTLFQPDGRLDYTRLQCWGTAPHTQFAGPWLLLSREAVSPGCLVTLRHALPERTSTERFSSGATYRLLWRGDDVVGLDPHDGPMTMHPLMPAGRA